MTEKSKQCLGTLIKNLMLLSVFKFRKGNGKTIYIYKLIQHIGKSKHVKI